MTVTILCNTERISVNSLRLSSVKILKELFKLGWLAHFSFIKIWDLIHRLTFSAVIIILSGKWALRKSKLTLKNVMKNKSGRDIIIVWLTHEGCDQVKGDICLPKGHCLWLGHVSLSFTPIMPCVHIHTFIHPYFHLSILSSIHPSIHHPLIQQIHVHHLLDVTMLGGGHTR